jgi:fumarate reductase flavoprotein subunit
MARNVALTSGGYSSNSEMFEKLEGHKRYTAMSSPHSQGIGITLGLAAGGFVRGGEKHLPLFGAVMADDNIPSRSIGGIRQWIPDREPWEIMVNARGERFYPEDAPSFDTQEHALVKQPDERAWAVFDQAIFDEAPPLLKGGNWSHESVAQAFDSQHPSFYKANTLQELAKLAGVDAKGLAATVARYNKAQKSGKDPFGRTHMPRPIAKGPFYAIRIQGYVLTSFAGLGVDNELRVIRKDGSVIPGLFAAGELLGTGQLMGNSYCGGMTVTPSLTFGRLMGQKFFQMEA